METTENIQMTTTEPTIVATIAPASPPTKKVIKRWVNKDGTIQTKEYDQKAYSQKHYEKNKSKYLEKMMCGCGIEYSPSNRHNHITTRVHKLFDKMSKTAITASI